MKPKAAAIARKLPGFIAALMLGLASSPRLAAQITDKLIYLTDVPDYQWNWGCFGTASGNLAGYWDRHGMTNLYAGSIGGGMAPLDSLGGNTGIQSLWASTGHLQDYYTSYEYSGPDPFTSPPRLEHSPDCIGDFIGLSQNKWTNLNNECRGNIDAYSFVFWDKSGARRVNHYTTNGGVYIPDIGSGFKEWARYRGYDADVFTQLADFNPERTNPANGFTYEDVKAEIDAGYPVLCFLQPNGQYSSPRGNVPNGNPPIHGVMIFGYFSDSSSGVEKGIIIRTSWATGDTLQKYTSWTGADWLGLFPVRGVIGFHPKPKVIRFNRDGSNITLNWDGPSARVYDELSGQTTTPHRYCIQRTTSFNPPNWKPVAGPTTALSITFTESSPSNSFYRVVQIGQGNCP
jgi:hypothetical protein